MSKLNFIIRNKGILVEEDLFLIGSSYGKEGGTKIGMYGSGWKYALACLMRECLELKIISGKDKVYEIDTCIRNHRDKTIRVVTINEKETSMTTEMGQYEWKTWMAVREIVSNALDEGEMEMFTNVSKENISDYVKDDYTCVVIEQSKEMQEIILNFEEYFTFERKGLLEDINGTKIFLNASDKKHSTYFRKGIRCFDDKEAKNLGTGLIDIDFETINISENRLSSESEIRSRIRQLTNRNLAVKTWRALFLNFDDFHSLMNSCENNSLKEFVTVEQTNGKVFIPAFLKKIYGDFITKNYYVLPSDIYKAYLAEGIIKNENEDMAVGAVVKELPEVATVLSKMFRVPVKCSIVRDNNSESYYNSNLRVWIINLTEESIGDDYKTKDIIATILGYKTSHTTFTELLAIYGL